MKTNEPIEIHDYSPGWPDEFQAIATQLRQALGDIALRIDHIGSTSIPGLAAKPIIDIQISVVSLEPVAPFRLPLESLGYVWRQDNPRRPKDTSAKNQAAVAPTFTSGKQEAGTSNLPCSSATTSASTPRTRKSMKM